MTTTSQALHIPAVIKPHITDVGPPLGSAKDKDADRAVQEFKIAKASPSIARGLKWRLSSALWPIEAYTRGKSAFNPCSGKSQKRQVGLQESLISCNQVQGI